MVSRSAFAAAFGAATRTGSAVATAPGTEPDPPPAVGTPLVIPETTVAKVAPAIRPKTAPMAMKSEARRAGTPTSRMVPQPRQRDVPTASGREQFGQEKTSCEPSPIGIASMPASCDTSRDADPRLQGRVIAMVRTRLRGAALTRPPQVEGGARLRVHSRRCPHAPAT